MKLKSVLKAIVGTAVLSGTLAAANAATYDLGAISVGVPKSFQGIVGPGLFGDTFTFTMPNNGGSGYSVIDFPLALPGFTFSTSFSAITLYSSGADGAPGGVGLNADTLLTSSTTPGSGTLTMQFGPSTAGAYFIDVFGRGEGTAGGLYNGSISVSALAPVPEPESYAMLLAGLGVMGAIAVRRNKRKQD